MKSLWTDWEKIRKNLQQRPLLICLDYDGTLAAIVDHYADAVILRENKRILQKLSKQPDVVLAIVSGRKLSDVKKRVGIKDIFYIGNHGLEIVGPGITYQSFADGGTKKIFRNIKNDLVRHVKKIKGVLIQDKGLTLSVHYRRVTADDLIFLKGVFSGVLCPYRASGEISVRDGKKVFEVTPSLEWDKGKATVWLLKRLSKSKRYQDLFPVFIGDDATDETAFAALQQEGLSVRVGPSQQSLAPYYLRDIDHVTRFLECLLT